MHLKQGAGTSRSLDHSADWCTWPQAGPVIDAGGIFDYARQTGMIKKAA